MKNQVTEHAEETQSITEFFSVSLCATSVNLCVPNLDFFSALLGSPRTEEGVLCASKT
jgi:hypothetical protein